MRIILLIVLFFSVSIAYAGQEYNPFEDRWETTPSNSELEYNPFEDEWTYEPPNSELEYNPWEDRWEYNQDDRN